MVARHVETHKEKIKVIGLNSGQSACLWWGGVG